MQVEVGEGVVLDNSRVRIDDMPIGIFTGRFAITPRERAHVKDVCQSIWRHLRKECKGKDPVGIYRFDLVPAFARASGKEGDLGELYIKGIYEVNGHSPECASAASVMRYFYENSIYCIYVAEIIAEKIIKQFGDVEIAFVVGHGSRLKTNWEKLFVKDLISAGLKITVMTPNEVMRKKPSHIWRWGDVRRDGENDFREHPEFTQWLYEQDECIVFNNILQPEEDITNKSLLLSSTDPCVASLLGDNRVLNEESMKWSTEEWDYQSLMAKPNGGSSGNGLIFGEHYSSRRWQQKLKNLIEKGLSYSLWQTQWLPAISVGSERLAIDFNPTFWVNGDNIEYLYSIIRMDPYSNYRIMRRINVSKGGCIAGLIY